MPVVTARDETPVIPPEGRRQDGDAAPPVRRAPSRLVRVLHVVNGEHYSGAERVQDLLAARLPEFGFGVEFACLRPDRFPRERKCRTAPLYELPMRRRWDLRPAWRLARLVRREGYALLHAHTPRAALIAALAAAAARKPLVYHVHSPAGRDSTRRWQERINAVVERLCLRRACRLIAVSQGLALQLRQAGYPDEQVCVALNGVPDAPVIRSPMPPGVAFTFGMAALFRPRKGTEIAFETLALLRRQGRDVRLRMIGPCETADYAAELRRRAQDLRVDDAIEWLGYTREAPAEIAKLDLLILPSLFGEGLPMVLLEAMAAGVPVAATRIAGVTEAIRDGVDGVLAAPGDPVDLARAIALVLDGERDWSELRENAQARRTELYSDRAMARRVAEIYRDVLEA